MQHDMIAILPQRRPFQLFEFALVEPELCRLGDGDAGVLRGVHAPLHLAARRDEPGVGRLLGRERLEVPLAGLVEIVGDPRRLVLAAGFPCACGRYCAVCSLLFIPFSLYIVTSIPMVNGSWTHGDDARTRHREGGCSPEPRRPGRLYRLHP